MKGKRGLLVPLLLLAGFWLGGCKDSEAHARIDALTVRVDKAEANLAKLNELHRWVFNDLWPKYVELHKKVWGSGPGDPQPPPTPPPPFE